jgi:hypothetical protein
LPFAARPETLNLLLVGTSSMTLKPSSHSPKRCLSLFTHQVIKSSTFRAMTL